MNNTTTSTVSAPNTVNTVNTASIISPVSDIFAGLLAGLLSVFLVVYAFQPNRPYPSWILEPAEQPWIFILILIAIVYLFKWDYMIGVLALLCVLAVILDLVIFTSASNKAREIRETFETQDPQDPQDPQEPFEIDEALYTPSISLIPNLSKSKDSKEGFENQKEIPKILPEEEQISKKWTTNVKPIPYDISRNNMVGSMENSQQAIASGLPLAYLNDKGYYPMFDSA